MGNSTGIEGLNEVLTNLNREVKRMGGATLKGCILAAIEVRRSMEKQSPKTPVDTGNLRSSWFLITSKGEMIAGNEDAPSYSDSKPAVLIGFSANYAIWVHEMVDAKFQRPGAGAKFLEMALKNNAEKILQIIFENAKID